MTTPERDDVAATDATAYRRAVHALVDDLTAIGHTTAAGGSDASTVALRHLRSGPLAPYLDRAGDGTVEALIAGLDDFVPTPVSSARDVPSLMRVRLLSLLESEWWDGAQPYATDDDVRGSADLVDLRRARRQGLLLFDFRVQVHDVVRRGIRFVDRRCAPRRSPATIGMRLPYARPAVVELLNVCAHRLSVADPSAPRLWANSCVRSVDYQNSMRADGYLAREGSTHCSGWAADVEMDWMRRRGCGDTLAGILTDVRDSGLANVIDEGQAWHLCVDPHAARDLEHDWQRHLSMGRIG